MLYAIQRGADGPVKLGMAQDPTKRLRALQTAHDAQLFLRAAWDGDHADERALQLRFEASRVRGEWFRLTPDVVAFRSGSEPNLRAATRRLRVASEIRAAELRAAATRAVERRAIEVYARARLHHRPHVLRDDPERTDVLSRAKSCGADQWFAIFCDLMPSMGADVLLAYVELVVRADRDGRVEVDLERFATHVFGHGDRAAIATLLCHLRDVQLPADDSPYVTGARARLVEAVRVCHAVEPPSDRGVAWPSERRQLDRNEGDLIAASAADDVTELVLVRYGAGFGTKAVPSTYPRDAPFAERHAWAQQMLAPARVRARAFTPPRTLRAELPKQLRLIASDAPPAGAPSRIGVPALASGAVTAMCHAPACGRVWPRRSCCRLTPREL